MNTYTRRTTWALILLATVASNPTQALEFTFLTNAALINRVTFDAYLGNSDDQFIPGLNNIGAATQFAGNNTTYGFLGGTMSVAGVTPFGLQEHQYIGISTHTAASMFGEWNSNFLGSFNNPFTQSLDTGSPSVITHSPDQTYTTVFTYFDDAYQGRLTITGTGNYLRNWQSPTDYYSGDELTHYQTVLPLLPAGWVGVAHELQSWVVNDGPQAGATGVTTTTFYTLDYDAVPDGTTPEVLGAPWIISGYAATVDADGLSAAIGSPYAPAIAGSALLSGGNEATLTSVALGGVGEGTLTVQGAGTVLHVGAPSGTLGAFSAASGTLNVLDGARVETSLLLRQGEGALHTVIDGVGSVLAMSAPGAGTIGLIDQGFSPLAGESTTVIRNGGRLEISAQGEQSALLILFASHSMSVDGPGSAVLVHGTQTGSSPQLSTSVVVEQGTSLQITGGASLQIDEPSSGIGGVALGGLLLPDTFSTAPATVLVDGAGSLLDGGAAVSVGEHYEFDPVTGIYFRNGTAGGSSVLTVRNGGRVIATDLLVGLAGTLNGSGGTIEAMVENHGLVDVGQSPGVMNIEGDFTQGADGRLLIEIGGTAAGSEYDVLNVSGVAHLGGTLEIVLLDGFAPGLSDTFDFLSALSFDGAFDQLILPLLGNGRQLELRFGPDGIGAVVTSVPLPGVTWLFVAGSAFLLRRRPAQSRSIDAISDAG